MPHQKNPTQKWILLVLVIMILGGLIAFMMSKRTTPTDTTLQITEPVSKTDAESLQSEIPTPQTNSALETSVTIQATPTEQKSGYKDGTYSATGNYVSPGGADAILVSLVLKDNVVQDVTMTEKASNPASKTWATKFISAAKSEIVGKKIDELNLKVVSGSSLTSVGFMDALAKIKVQAKA